MKPERHEARVERVMSVEGNATWIARRTSRRRSMRRKCGRRVT